MKTIPLSSGPSTRRDFVSKMALAGAALPFASLSPEAKAARPASSAPATGPMTPRSPTCIHVFSKPLQWLSYEAAAELAAETGFGGIDFSVRPAGHVEPERVEEDLPRAVEAAHKAGLKVEMITTGIADAHDKHTAPILRTAAKLGVKFYRLGGLPYNPREEVWKTVQKYKAVVKDLADLNREHGLHGAFQNHPGGRVASPIWDLFELVRELDPRWIGSQYDVRHATCEGGLSWPLGLRLIHPWIKCTDIKDFKWVQAPGRGTPENVPMGEGIVDYDLYFKMVRELNIGGPMSMHFEYPPFERLKPIPAAAERRKLIGAAMQRDIQALKVRMAKHQIA